MVKSLKTLEVNFQCENCEDERLLGFYSQDLKQAVLEFKDILESYQKEEYVDSMDFSVIIDSYSKIFGDFSIK